MKCKPELLLLLDFKLQTCNQDHYSTIDALLLIKTWWLITLIPISSNAIAFHPLNLLFTKQTTAIQNNTPVYFHQKAAILSKPYNIAIFKIPAVFVLVEWHGQRKLISIFINYLHFCALTVIRNLENCGFYYITGW